GYPLLIRALAHWRGRDVHRVVYDDADLPEILVLMVVRNQQERIRAKLENLLSSNYPADKLSIFVALDGCTDGTGSIVWEYSKQRVRWRAFPRTGKAGIISSVL